VHRNDFPTATHVEDYLRRAGFNLRSELVHEPDDDGLESTPQVFPIARKGVVAQ
jgi:hypothetical protein